MLIFTRLLLFAFVMLVSFRLGAQDIRFSKVSADEGLSSNTVNCIFQDFRGFLWVGTPDGLNRYDGYSFQVYRSGGDSLMLSDNAVWAIAQTKDSSLWVGTSAGLNKFNRRKNLFQHINLTTEKNDVLHNSVISLLTDSEGNLWVGTLKGLTKITEVSKKGQKIKNFSGDDFEAIKSAAILDLAQDNAGNIWLAADSAGLFKMERGDKLSKINLPENLPVKKINSVAFDALKNEIWVGTDAGLVRFLKDGSFRHYQSDEKKTNSLKENSIQKVFADKNGRIWVGTNTQGLCLFRPQSETFLNFKRDINNPHSFSDNSYVRAIYEDMTGIVWFGTQDGGLNKYDPSKTKFSTVSASRYFQFVNPNSAITVIHEDNNGHLWLGASEAGITRIAPTYTKNFTTNDGLMSNRISGIVNDKYGSLWFSTKDKGVGKMAYTGGKMSVVAYQVKKGDEGLPSNQIQKLFRDKEGEIWAITAQGAFCKFNRAINDFEVVIEGGARGSNVPSPVYVTKEGNFWIGTPRGFYLFDPKEKTVLKDYRGKNAKNINTVYALYQASDTILWIGSIRGLSKFYLKKDSVVNYASKQGLAGDVVFNILEDSLSTIWVTTNKGLSRFNPKQSNFRNYDASNGLISGEFQQNAVIKSSTGKLYFGGSGGYTSFYPSEIKDNPHKPQIVFLDLEIFSQPLPINVPIVFERPARDTETSELTDFVLFYDDFNFDIQFAALHFSDPKKNQYEYMLENYESKWNKRDWTRRFISYNNLPYGDYYLRVRASNSDGVWNEEGVRLKIVVQPPIWDKWSFKIGLVVFILLSIYIFNTIRLRRIKKQNERLERIVEERTEEIREKTTQILDSIRYAETIQSAILPTDEEFKTFLPSGFRLYLPRDIVSGDFYWLKHVNKRTYVAVVDCTGHGVPGAFMSMIAASLLNDTVNQSAKASTSEVLTTLNEKIRVALRQEDERNTDGMDIALCAIDEDENKLLFTGAKRSLYIVRNQEIIELKGDRKSVGGRTKKDREEKIFTTKEFKLQNGDMIYLTTDGFVDQPDENGKKYGSLNFFEDLKKIADKTPQEQKKILAEKLKQHSGSAKQRDDITIIGFKI